MSLSNSFNSTHPQIQLLSLIFECPPKILLFDPLVVFLQLRADSRNLHECDLWERLRYLLILWGHEAHKHLWLVAHLQSAQVHFQCKYHLIAQYAHLRKSKLHSYQKTRWLDFSWSWRAGLTSEDSFLCLPGFLCVQKFYQKKSELNL